MNHTVAQPPNFRGDQVKFTRRDASGNVTSAGAMHRDRIAEERAAGGRIEIEDDDHPGLVNRTVTVDRLGALKVAIAAILDRTDRYFVADALDNIQPAEQARWRTYRQALRDAAKLGSVAEMLAALPPRDPKGADHFLTFRGQ